MSLTNKDLEQLKALFSLIFDDKVKELKLVTKDDISHIPTKHEFYNKMDEQVTELKALREEVEIANHRSSENRDRIESVEHKLTITPA